jgi:hypothetical protein
LSKLRKQLNTHAKLELNTRKKPSNKLKNARNQPCKQSHQVISVKTALALLTLVFKLKMRHLLHHPKSHHVATTSTSHKSLDSTS